MVVVSSGRSFALLLLLLIPSTNAFTSNVLGTQVSSTGASSTALSGVGSVVSRVRDSLTSKERSREDLKLGIAGFYDRSSQLWEEGANAIFEHTVYFEF